MQYYSDKTKQLYVKKDELIAAEKEWDKAHALELKKADERKSRAKAVEDIKDYGSYHSTVNSIVDLTDILNQMFIF